MENSESYKLSDDQAASSYKKAYMRDVERL